MSLPRALFCVTCLGVCVLTLLSLAAVLSYPDFERARRPVESRSRCDQAWDLAFDVVLIVSAFFLHYLLNCMDLFADFSANSQRCIYSVVTALITQAGLFYWRRTSDFNLWSFGDLSEPARCLILVLHAMSYLQLIANSVFDDAIEAFGFRGGRSTRKTAASYDEVDEDAAVVSSLCFETASPSSYFNKSQELARLEGRLPSSGGLTSLTVLFLLYPTMPLERALVTLAILSYNFCTSTLDEQDYFYVRRNFNTKWNELLNDDLTAGSLTNGSTRAAMSGFGSDDDDVDGDYFGQQQQQRQRVGNAAMGSSRISKTSGTINTTTTTTVSGSGAASAYRSSASFASSTTSHNRRQAKTSDSVSWATPVSRSSSQESFLFEERTVSSATAAPASAAAAGATPISIRSSRNLSSAELHQRHQVVADSPPARRTVSTRTITRSSRKL